ncbi:UNVERIFIED_CONTAM: hypothetical protein ABID98_000878 [Brevibacillus sp. OAP136]
MWVYEKKLEIPVRVGKPDLQMARFLSAQYGGPHRPKVKKLNRKDKLDPIPLKHGNLVNQAADDRF